MSESSAPNAPTARRIQPIVWISIPLTVALTAQTRTAPTATRRRLTPIPMNLSPFDGILRVCRENAETPCEDTAVEELQKRRAYLCRLTPDRALESREEALAFLSDRWMLTRTPDSALPSLFGACHEEPYAAGSRGFGSWPATKYPWYFRLAERPDVHELKIHNGKSLLLTDENLALVDSICRAELARMESDAKVAPLLSHLSADGPST